MQTVRRLYIYLMSGITLGTLAVGLTMLLRVLFEQLGLGPTGELLGGDRSETIRRELSVAIALVGVSTPVWLLHWWLAERSLRAGRPNAEAERGSTIRALYFTVVLGVLLVFGVLAAMDLVGGVLLRLLGEAEGLFDDPGAAVATLIVTGAAWTYHTAVRRRDLAVGPLDGAAGWLPRVYLYLAAFGGLALLLTGIGALMATTGEALVGEPQVFEPSGADFRFVSLAHAVAQSLVGAAAWLGHWEYSGRLVRQPGWRGAGERAARLRLAYYVAAIALGAVGVITELSEAIRGVLVALLDAVPPDVRGGEAVTAMVVPAASVLPYAAAWWLHLRWARTEAEEAVDHGRELVVRRLDGYAVGLVGVAFGAIGLGWLLGLAIDVVLGGTRVVVGSDFWRVELSHFLPFAVIGGSIWLWKWAGVVARQVTHPEAEAESTVRRAYLLIVLAGSVLTGLGSLGVVVYRLVSGLLGVDETGSLVSELSTPLGALLVATAVAAYHGLALRRDQALRTEVALSEAAAAAAATSAGVQAAHLPLVLSGPPDADLAVALEGLRSVLPEGYRLEPG